MNKKLFLNTLKKHLYPLPAEEIEKSAVFYNEMIDDRMEDGMSEEAAVAALGSIEEIASNILSEVSLPTLVKARVKKSKENSDNTALWITLAVLGSPLWIPLVFAAILVVFSLYLALFSLVLSGFAVVASLILSGVTVTIATFFQGNGLNLSLFNFGLGLFTIGIGLLLIKPALWFAKTTVSLITIMGKKIKLIFTKNKEKNNETP